MKDLCTALAALVVRFSLTVPAVCWARRAAAPRMSWSNCPPTPP
jgi:hypothetical protein